MKKTQNKKNINKKIKIIIIFVLLILITIAGCSLNLLLKVKDRDKSKIVEDIIDEQIQTVDNSRYQELKKIWLSNKQINGDYVGQVTFDSKLIDLPFVCPNKGLNDYKLYDYNGGIITDLDAGCEGGACTGNDVYLRANWETSKYDIGGSIFMDYRNTINDQNIIIYGHSYAPKYDENREKMFTALEKLLKQENYQDNKYLEISLENEIRRYEVAYVYIFHTNMNAYDDYDMLQYYRTNYEFDYYGNEDEGFYEKYINRLEKVKLYDTGVKLSTKDNTLTLQTCIVNTSDQKEIVVCKEIERTQIKEK